MGIEVGTAALIGTALSAIGTGVSMMQAQKSKKDMNAALMSQLDKADAQSARSRPVLDNSLAESGAQQTIGRMGSGKELAEQVYAGIDASTSGATTPLPTNDALLQGKVGQARKAAATGQGYQDAGVADWVRNQEAARQLGVNSNLASNAAGTAPILTQLAGNKSAGLAGLGSLLSTAGGLAGIYGGLQSGQQARKVKVGGVPQEATTRDWNTTA